MMIDDESVEQFQFHIPKLYLSSLWGRGPNFYPYTSILLLVRVSQK